MNDPVSILTAALLRSRGRFEFYAANHTEKADKLNRLITDTPLGLDPDAVLDTQKLIADTLNKARANRDEVDAVDQALKQASVEPVRSSDTLPNTALAVAETLPLNFFTRSSLDANADHLTQLIAFHDTYGVPMHELGNTDPNFSHMDDARVAMRLDLIAEEVIELFEDGFGITIEMKILDTDLDVGTNSITEAMGRFQQRDGVEVVDALGDIVYLCYGMALELGYDLRAAIREIHAGNLTKLGADGVPIMREDGKVLKGPNYRPPNIAKALGFIVHEAS